MVESAKSGHVRWQTAWVVGASSGIGEAVARDLAASGTRVAVTARSAEKLAKLAASDPQISAFPGDVTKLDSLTDTYQKVKSELGAPELVVTSFGTWTQQKIDGFSSDVFAQSMAVNFQGAVHVLDLILPDFLQRGRGQIGLISSIAGYRGLVHAGAYGASKAALIYLAESLKPELDPRGIDISIINPGFVKTPMTAVNRFPMPFMISAEAASRHILAGLARKKFEIAFPWQMRLWFKFTRLLPYSLYFKLSPKPGAKK